MRSDEQFKQAIRDRCDQRRAARKRAVAGILGGMVCIAVISYAAFILTLPKPQNKEDILSSEGIVPAPETVLVEVCSPDGSEVYCSFTEREDIYALIRYQPDVNEPPEVLLDTADQLKSDSSDEVPFFSFSVRYTDAEGNVNRYLITDDSSLYSTDLYMQGWTMALPEAAAPLIQQLKELGWEAP